MPGDQSDTTSLLNALAGDASNAAVNALSDRLYSDLHALARKLLTSDPKASLQTTDLVHEAYLRLVDQRRVEWNGRVHFIAIAARVMRRVLADQARRRGAAKRGGDRTRVTLASDVGAERGSWTALHLDASLSRLASVDERKADVVVLRALGGLRCGEVAEFLGVSLRTAERDWRAGRAFIIQDIAGAGAV